MTRSSKASHRSNNGHPKGIKKKRPLARSRKPSISIAQEENVMDSIESCLLELEVQQLAPSSTTAVDPSSGQALVGSLSDQTNEESTGVSNSKKRGSDTNATTASSRKRHDADHSNGNNDSNSSTKGGTEKSSRGDRPGKRIKTTTVAPPSIPLSFLMRNQENPSHLFFTPSLAREHREQIIEWNRAFRRWADANQYTLRDLFPSFDQELTRHFKVGELSEYLLESCRRSPSGNDREKNQSKTTDEEGSDETGKRPPQESLPLRMPSFERWLWDCKLEDQLRPDVEETTKDKQQQPSLKDPILTHHAHTCDASKRLEDEIVEACDGQKSREEAQALVRELCRRTDVALAELGSSSYATAKSTLCPLRKGDRIELDFSSSTTTKKSIIEESQGNTAVVSLSFIRKRWKKPFRIKLNDEHYEKLKRAFLETHNRVIRASSSGMKELRTVDSQGRPTKAVHAFHLILMTLLLRYSSISGGQLLHSLRGGGMQGAVHSELFAALEEAFPGQPLLEGFASPFNSSNPYFCTGFADIDFHFGGLGSFWNVEFQTDCCCEVNPPFSPGIMDLMTHKMNHQLERADEKGCAISFVVVVPSANSRNEQEGSESDTIDTQIPVAKRMASSSFEAMLSSQYFRSHWVLRAREHGYVEGAQHLRPTKFKESSYDTSIILLQSKKAAAGPHPNLQSLEEEVRRAFSSRHRLEIQKRSETSCA